MVAHRVKEVVAAAGSSTKKGFGPF